MSTPSVSDLSAKVDLLTEQVAQLALAVDRLTLSSRPPSTSYRLVDSPTVSDRRGAPSIGYPASSAGSTTTEDRYNDLAREIPPVPDLAVRLCSNLRSGNLSFQQRAQRAWECGYWARYVLEERVRRPRPSQPIDLSNSIYVVLRAPGLAQPVICTKASDYRFLLQDFQQNSLSHGFPSQSEARVYCLGAGIDYPSRVYQWSPQN